MGNCVVRYLEPVNAPQARSIILFRATSDNPALFINQNGAQEEEPKRYRADTNGVPVASEAYLWIKSDIAKALKSTTRAKRHITLIGHSISGALAMRTLKHYCEHNKASMWKNARLYIFSSVGVSPWCAARLDSFF